MAYTQADFRTDLKTLDDQVASLQAKFTGDGPARLTQTHAEIVDIRNLIKRMREAYASALDNDFSVTGDGPLL